MQNYNLKFKILIILLTGAILFNLAPTVSAANYDQAKAVQYLKNNSQNDWAIIALGVANSLSGVDTAFLKNDPGAKPTDIEKRILAIAAAGQNPETFNPAGLVARLATFFNGTEIVTPGDPTLLSDDVFGLLALSAANKHPEIRNQLSSFIKQNQNADGGWSHFKAGQSNSDYTAMAAYALISTGAPKNSQTLSRAFDFISTTKKSTGWSHFVNGSADPYTTSWVIPALSSAGREVPASAIQFLTDFQKPNGSFDNSALLTAYAVIALQGQNSPPSDQSANFQISVIGPSGSIWSGQVGFNTAATVLDALREASKQAGFGYVTKNTSLGLFVESIAGIGPQGERGWMYAVNGNKPSMSAAQYVLTNGDSVIWFYGAPQDLPPSSGQSLQNVNLTVNIVNNPPAAPSLNLTASRTQIKLGEVVELSWNTQNATRVVSSTPNNWAGQILSASIFVQPAQTTIYSLKVGGPGGVAEKSITVNVNQTPSIVFGIDKSSVNFGNLKQGESATQSIRITNQGSTAIKITTSLQSADNLYQSLSLNNISWQNYQTELAANFAKNINLALQVPGNYQGSGTKTGALILWATAK